MFGDGITGLFIYYFMVGRVLSWKVCCEPQSKLLFRINPNKNNMR